MAGYNLIYTRKALKHQKFIEKSPLKHKVKLLLEGLMIDPFDSSYGFEQLKYFDPARYSKRINVDHRLAYEVYEDLKTIKILTMWGHY